MNVTVASPPAQFQPSSVAERSHPTSLAEVRELVNASSDPSAVTASLRAVADALSTETAAAAEPLLCAAHDSAAPDPGTLLEALAVSARAADQLQARQLRERARFALAQILEDGEEEIGLLFESSPGAPAPADVSSLEPGADPASAPCVPATVPVLPGTHDGSLRAFFSALLPRQDAMTLSAVHNSTQVRERGAAAGAVLVLLGLPELLRTVENGDLPFNHIERLLPKTRLMSLAQLHLLDVFLTDLDRKLDLGRYLRAAQKFITALEGTSLTPAQVRRERRVVLERHDDGSGSLTMHGPLVILEALYQRTRGMARAILRSQIGALALELEDGGSARSADARSADANEAGTNEAGALEDADSAPAGGLGGAPACRLGSAPGCRLGFAPVTAQVVDERQFGQMMFDLLADSRPETVTSVIEAGDGDGSRAPRTEVPLRPGTGAGSSERSGPPSGTGAPSDRDPLGGSDQMRRHQVRVLCPTDGEWLRRQASVNVTVPATALLRADDRPGELAGAAPLPAEFARQVAAHSRDWHRILTDPATGTVLDEPARTYAPTRATRAVVNTKWQTCTAPGCTAPAQNAEFEHGIPFDHVRPERGGPTHPSNGHPMCRRCHALKTAGIIRMERTGANEILWSLPLGVTVTTVAPPIDAGAVLSRSIAEIAETDSAGDSTPVPPDIALPRCITTPQAAARLAADVFARLEAEERQIQSLRQAGSALSLRDSLRLAEDRRQFRTRESRLVHRLRELQIERAHLEAAKRAHGECLSVLEARELANEELTWKIAERDEALRAREKRVARTEREWWARTREEHLRRLTLARQCEAANEEAARRAHIEFAQLLERPGVCRHTDLEAALAQMRSGVDSLPATVEECPDCEAEYAAFLIEIRALNSQEVEDLVWEEELRSRAERARERERAQERERERIREIRVREVKAQAEAAEERSYIRESQRLGRERARLEHAETLPAVCTADCCTAARSQVRPGEKDKATGRTGSAEADRGNPETDTASAEADAGDTGTTTDTGDSTVAVSAASPATASATEGTAVDETGGKTASGTEGEAAGSAPRSRGDRLRAAVDQVMSGCARGPQTAPGGAGPSAAGSRTTAPARWGYGGSIGFCSEDPPPF